MKRRQSPGGAAQASPKKTPGGKRVMISAAAAKVQSFSRSAAPSQMIDLDDLFKKDSGSLPLGPSPARASKAAKSANAKKRLLSPGTEEEVLTWDAKSDETPLFSLAQLDSKVEVEYDTETMTGPQLRSALKERLLDTHGTRLELKERLEAALLADVDRKNVLSPRGLKASSAAHKEKRSVAPTQAPRQAPTPSRKSAASVPSAPVTPPTPQTKTPQAKSTQAKKALSPKTASPATRKPQASASALVSPQSRTKTVASRRRLTSYHLQVPEDAVDPLDGHRQRSLVNKQWQSYVC
jgi:hypothetical protein